MTSDKQKQIAALMRVAETNGRSLTNLNWHCSDGGSKYHVLSNGTVTGVSYGCGRNSNWRDADDRMYDTVLTSMKSDLRQIITNKMIDDLVASELAKAGV